MIDVDAAWQEHWDAAFDETKERHPEFDPEDYYRSGRASKDWPNKETPEWWAKQGPLFVKSWVKWRELCGLKIWEFPDEDGVLQPGIEVEAWAYSDDERNLSIRSIIDRVMVDDQGDLYIVDLKSGSHTDAWPRQMALNNLGLYYTFGVHAKYAGFWKSRKGGVEKWFDLSIYTDEWLWDMAWKAREIRDRQLFLPQPGNLCASACGVSQHCVAMGGVPFFRNHATLTQTQETK